MDAVVDVPSNTVTVSLKGGVTVDVDTGRIPDAMLPHVYVNGLKTILGARMSKITKSAYPNKADLEAKVLEVAEENLANLYEGKARVGNKVVGKAVKESAATVTEARRQAKARVKEELKAKGHKLSHIPAKEITAFANAMVANDPTWIKLAKAALAEQAKVTITGVEFGAVKADPKLVAKAEKDKARLKELSAAKGAPRRRPAPQHAH